MKRVSVFIALAVVSLALSVSFNVVVARAAMPQAQNQSEKQPEMNAAIEHLREAQKNLEAASHDKGGHRAKALNLVRQAISEVQQGVNYDNTHTSGTEKPKPKTK